MEDILSWILIIIFITVAIAIILAIYIGLPFFIAILGYKKIKNRKLKLLFPVLFIIYIIWQAYQWYCAIYPDERFYIEEFTKNISVQFPKSAKFIEKYSEFPNHFGQYQSYARIKVSKQDFDTLKQQSKSKEFYISYENKFIIEFNDSDTTIYYKYIKS